MPADRTQDASAPTQTLKTKPPKAKPKSKLASLPPSIARLLTAFVLLPILVASIIVAKLTPLFVLIIAMAMVFGLFEFWLLALKQQVRPDRAAGILGAAALFIEFLYTKPGP